MHLFWREGKGGRERGFIRAAYRLSSDCSNSGKSKDLVIVQSMQLGVSAGLRFQSVFQLYAGIPTKSAGRNASEGMCLPGE